MSPSEYKLVAVALIAVAWLATWLARRRKWIAAKAADLALDGMADAVILGRGARRKGRRLRDLVEERVEEREPSFEKGANVSQSRIVNDTR